MIHLLMIFMLSSEPVDSSEQVCHQFQQMAEIAMTARQSGLSIADFYDRVSGDEFSELFRTSMKNIANEAYKEPLFRAPKNKQTAITEFANRYFVACINLDWKKS